MEEETKDQLIQDYLEGKLEDKDLKDFENRLQQDPALAAEVQEFQDLELGLHGIGADQFKEEVKQWEAAYRQTQQPAHKVFSLRRYYAVAATIALFIVAGIYFLMPGTPGMDQLYAQNYVPYEDMILDRSNASEGAQSFLVAGMEAYNQQQYAQAAENLQAYLREAPSQYGAALYLGIAQMELNQFDEAESNFDLALQDPRFAQQAQWYRALLYLKSQQPEKAKAALQAIAQNPQHYKSGTAANLSEELE